MAIKYGFFNSVNGDRKYTAADIGDYLRGIIYSGVYPDGTSSLQVLAAGGMVVEVQPGRAMLEFKYLKNDAPHQITLSAGGTMDRIDAIVAYMDLNERACGITVREGTPAAAPVAPAMTRTDVRYEVMLASVYVTRLVNEVTQANITDTRHLTEVCGWVRGAIRQNTADIPVPAPATAGYIPHVTQDGNGYELLAVDNTLAIAGRAADAAATGKALAGKAPAGYGLGVESKLLTSADDLNNIKANGWYSWHMDNAPANAPVEYAWSNFQCCRVWTYDGGVCLQEIVELGYNPQVAGVKVQRTIYGNDAQPWQCANPPMFVGVEYRTTERWDGAPVYTVLVDCGKTVASTKTQILTDIVCGAIVRIAGRIGGYTTPYIYEVIDSPYSVWATAHNQYGKLQVNTYAGANTGDLTAKIQVWYTK